MARRNKQNPATSTPSIEHEEPNTLITSENGIPHDLGPSNSVNG